VVNGAELYTTARTSPVRSHLTLSRFPQAQFLISAAAPGQFPPDRGAEVAFVGRSNAGKSSAINAITQRQGLARTSKTPGRTRLLNFFDLGAQRRIVDLPGYGYASAPEHERLAWKPMTEALRERSSLRGLFVIVDSRRGITGGDEGLLDWAAPHQRIHVLLSKADKLNRSESLKVLRESQAALGERATVQLFSAHGKTGVEEAQRTLDGWLAEKVG
jgi:GTP-binding protein